MDKYVEYVGEGELHFGTGVQLRPGLNLVTAEAAEKMIETMGGRVKIASEAAADAERSRIERLGLAKQGVAPSVLNSLGGVTASPATPAVSTSAPVSKAKPVPIRAADEAEKGKEQ